MCVIYFPHIVKTWCHSSVGHAHNCLWMTMILFEYFHSLFLLTVDLLQFTIKTPIVFLSLLRLDLLYTVFGTLSPWWELISSSGLLGPWTRLGPLYEHCCIRLVPLYGTSVVLSLPPLVWNRPSEWELSKERQPVPHPSATFTRSLLF